MNDSVKTYTLLGVDGKPYQSSTPRLLGGHKKAENIWTTRLSVCPTIYSKGTICEEQGFL